MRPWILVPIALSAVLGCATEVNYTPAEPAALLPDGMPFLSWTDRTRYSRTYHVNNRHPQAADGNPGSEALPFRTIQRAAELLQPGERVWIHSGVYREMIEPRVAGQGPERMIAYEAAPGARVTVKGSRVLESKWERSQDPHGKGVYSKKLWMAALPDALFEGGYFPFRTQNADEVEIGLMPWAARWKGRVPYSLPRGMLFEDGRRMQQLATYEDLVRLPGSFWVAPGGGVVHIQPYGGDPAGKLFEVAVQPHILRPKTPGMGFIRVTGLTLEHCANGFPRIGIGALYTRGGHHWIIERNTVRQANSVGIEFGYRTFEMQDKRHPPREDPDLGHTIVRGNRIHDCGTAGIRSHTVSHALVEHNDITDCGWQDVEYYWETAGIKMLVNTGTLVRHNRVGRIEAGSGIWLDWNNRNCRVSGNVIHDVRTAAGAVFIEASQVPNLVDHNVIWNVDGQAVRLADSDHTTVAHNLIGRIGEDLVYARVATSRSLGGRGLTSAGNRVVNNIFVDVAKPVALAEGADNAAEHNVTLSGGVRFDADELLLEWTPRQLLPAVPPVPVLKRDFFGRLSEGVMTAPGPFQQRLPPGAVRLGPDARRVGTY